MRNFPGLFFVTFFALAAFTTSCTEPKQRTPDVVEEPEVPKTPEPPRPAEEPKTKPTQPKPEPTEKEEDERYKDYATGVVQEPHLVVQFDPKDIKISGFLKSFRQRDRLEEDLQRMFPDRTVTNELKVDTDRQGVGWANRLADPFLNHFISKTKNGRLEYKEGIIYLDGVAGSQGDINGIIRLAGTIFIGPLSKDIESTLKVE